MGDREESIAQFMSVTGADATAAGFFLDSAKGSLDTALNAFFESGGEVPAQAQGAAPAAPPAGGGGGVVESEDDDDDDGAALEDAMEVAGGGTAEPKSLDDMTQSIFDKAEKSTRDGPDADERKKKQITFTGKGYALGKDPQPQTGAEAGPASGGAAPGGAGGSDGEAGKKAVVDRPPPKTYKVTVWKGNAFQVDEGEVRHPTNQENRSFMEDLAKGWVPLELRERSDTGVPVPVNINLEDRREHDASEATVKKPDFKAQAAAGGAGGARGASAGKVEAPKVDEKKLQSLKCDESKPVCVIQVRSPASGARAEARLNSARSVGDLREWIVANGMVGAGAGFTIMGGFPPKPLSDDKQTLDQAGLNGAAISIKLA